ncbi:MAG: hypothetical protein KJZ65_07270 [Phycisphaerales bacterium]|nr:hypothetical protein [Phycisphaerales bacterium]
MRLLHVLVSLAPIGLAAAKVPAQVTWNELARRFERAFDDLSAQIEQAREIARPQVGIFIPAEPGAKSAGTLPSKWVALPSEGAPATLVLLVHGLDEPGDIWCDLAPALVQAGHCVARFEYPNDQPVEKSSALLIEHLRRARSAGVTEISIVAHSMGGLVSFDAMTRADGYAGDASGGAGLPRVTRLIAVGTPWNGSPWARLRAITEVREQVQRWYMNESWDVRPLLQFRNDGLGEAGDELAEKSELIESLKQRPVPESLALTLVAGRLTSSEPEDLAWVEESTLLRRLLGRERVAELAGQLRAAAKELGDGVVPLESALARSQDDQVVLEANHRGLIRRTPVDFASGAEKDTPPPAIAVIVERLGKRQSE